MVDLTPEVAPEYFSDGSIINSIRNTRAIKAIADLGSISLKGRFTTQFSQIIRLSIKKCD